MEKQQHAHLRTVTLPGQALRTEVLSLRSASVSSWLPQLDCLGADLAEPLSKALPIYPEVSSCGVLVLSPLS